MTFHGCWIQPEEFRNLAPFSVFHREHQPLAEEYHHPESLQNLHMLVRTSVFLRGDEKQVLLRLTADDCYQLRVNGQFAGQMCIRDRDEHPDCSCPAFRRFLLPVGILSLVPCPQRNPGGGPGL